MDALGIDTADIGLPGAGPHVAEDVERLARADRRTAACGSRRTARRARKWRTSSRSPTSSSGPACRSSAAPSSDRARSGSTPKAGRSTTSSARRRGGRLRGQARSHGHVRHRGHDARGSGVAAPLVHDRDSRRRVAPLHRGHGRPRDAERRARARPLRDSRSSRELGVDVGIDWHGHRDRGFGVASSIAALEAGATRLHGAALGIGERCGNTPIDLLLVNLVMMGYRDSDLTALPAYCEAVSKATRRADSRELSGRRRRRVPHRHRRSCGSGREGVQQRAIGR